MVGILNVKVEQVWVTFYVVCVWVCGCVCEGVCVRVCVSVCVEIPNLFNYSTINFNQYQRRGGGDTQTWTFSLSQILNIQNVDKYIFRI